jgi:hypothetical protein
MVTINSYFLVTETGIKLLSFDLELLKWLLPYCPNLHTSVDNTTYALSAAGVNDFIQLKKLRDLSIALTKPIKLGEVIISLLIKDLTYLPLCFCDFRFFGIVCIWNLLT